MKRIVQKRYRNWSVLLVVLMCSLVAHGQSSEISDGNKKFAALAYVDAIKIFERVVESGFEDEDIYRKLGDSYYFNANYVAAASWYGKLFSLNEIQPPQYSFRYGQSLKATGYVDQADEVLRTYFTSQGVSYSSHSQYLELLEKQQEEYAVNTLTSNSKMSDYPGYLRGDDLYVISSKTGDKITPWTGEPTSDIYRQTADGLEPLGETINTKYNEGSIVLTSDGQTMYFTRNNFDGRKARKGEDKVIRLKLYKATLEGGVWTNITELPFNSNDYSVGHPALSVDDKTMYFVSDMPGGKGGTDIYQVAIQEDGSYESISNVVGINTFGNEMFPYVDSKGILYFSSNGHRENLGGLDVYRIASNSNGGYDGDVLNVGRPVNGAFDDFAFVIDGETQKGYVASNRGLVNSDDVYGLSRNPLYKAPHIFSFEGLAKDRRTGELLSNAVVSLLDDNNQVIARTVANEDGLYSFDNVDGNKVRFVRVEKDGYQTNEVPISGDDSYVDVPLDRRDIVIGQGSDLSDLLLDPIYFDLDLYEIRSDSKVELQKVIAVLTEYPQLQLDVRSHTDSRANDGYNMELSQRRVEATIDYIVRVGGIDRSRIQGKGMGETELRNGCSNGVECSEQEHQLNRRSEFIIRNK